MLHPPKLQMIQIKSLQDHHTFPKWKLSKISHFKSTTHSQSELSKISAFKTTTNSQGEFSKNQSWTPILKSYISQRCEQWMTRANASQGWLINGLFKTIFPLKLITSSLSGDLNNEHVEQSSPVSLMHHLFKTIFPLNLSYQLCLPGNLKSDCRAVLHSVFNAWPFQDHPPMKTTVLTQSSIS